MNDEHFTHNYSMFANIYGYMGLPLSRNPDDADVFVIGLPYDLGTSGRSGARGGHRCNSQRQPFQIPDEDSKVR